MPYANDGGNAWGATMCAPIVAEPDAPGQACEVFESQVSGLDTCAVGSMCWDVGPENLEGTCVAFCSGAEGDPFCDDPSRYCAAIGSVLILCLPTCDPLLQDCPEFLACHWLGQDFACIVDSSGPDEGAAGGECRFTNGCDPGLHCSDAGRCTPFCDLSAPACPAGQRCEPWYGDPALAKPGYANVGVCGPV